MITEIISSILFKSLGKLFPYLQTKIYPKQEFERDIQIDVISDNPISFSLNSEIPSATIYLKVDNKSQYLEVIVRVSLSSLWLRHDKGTQPIIKEIRNFPEVQIKPKDTEDLFYEIELNDRQINYLKNIKDTKKLSATLYLKVEVVSQLYKIKKELVCLENKPTKIEG